jgi:hypothetical protein
LGNRNETNSGCQSVSVNKSKEERVVVKRMTPNDFWVYFKNELDMWWNVERKTKYTAFKDDTKRTCLMLPFLVDIGQKKKFHVETEAFPHIDVGYFSDCTKSEWSKWSFEVAIEHENKPCPHWHDECSKLMGINAGLKVLITYFSETTDELYNEINEFQGIYKSRLYHQCDDNYLFVFIPLPEVDKSEFDKTDKYSVYEYKNDSLGKLQ